MLSCTIPLHCLTLRAKAAGTMSVSFKVKVNGGAFIRSGAPG